MPTSKPLLKLSSGWLASVERSHCGSGRLRAPVRVAQAQVIFDVCQGRTAVRRECAPDAIVESPRRCGGQVQVLRRQLDRAQVLALIALPPGSLAHALARLGDPVSPMYSGRGADICIARAKVSRAISGLS